MRSHDQAATMGHNEKRDFFSDKTGHIIRALKVQASGRYLDYIHDAQLYSRFMELPDHLVGHIMQLATAENLEAMGYPGARSNSGETLTTIYTVAMRKLEAEFGKGVYVSDMKGGFRGVRNTMEVKLRFIAIMDDITNKLMVQVYQAVEGNNA